MKDFNKKPNILFITIDALRARNLGCYGYPRDTSPNIDSYAKQGVLFNNFFSTYNCSHKSFLSILSGRHILGQDFEHYPSQNEMKSFFDSDGKFLQEILQKNNYKTGFLRKLFGWQKIGFDYYFKKDVHERSKKWNFIRTIKKSNILYKFSKSIFFNCYFIPKILESKIRFKNSGESATEKAIEIMKENNKNNFFIWLHYTETHVPHIFPHSLINKFKTEKKSKKIFDILTSIEGYSQKDIEFLKGCWKKNDTVEDIITKYDTAIFYVDSLIKRLIDTLKKEDLMKDTLVFILADHGESLGEHELYFTHEGLYDVTFNLPLIIFGKGIPKNKKINALTQLEDITPTILDLLKIKYNPISFDGESLVPLILDKKREIRDSIFMEEHVCGLERRGIRTLDHRYSESLDEQHSICKLCNTGHGPKRALYDLKKDSGELDNIIEKNKKLAKELKLKLDKKIKDLKTINEKRKIQKFINNLK